MTKPEKKPKSTTMLAAIAHEKVVTMRETLFDRVLRVTTDGNAKIDAFIEDLDPGVRKVFDRLDKSGDDGDE